MADAIKPDKDNNKKTPPLPRLLEHTERPTAAIKIPALWPTQHSPHLEWVTRPPLYGGMTSHRRWTRRAISPSLYPTKKRDSAYL
ncbi:hypothetical protein AVEN_55617-1 [Araneus ventricosus]|uniref:Uncharacterized protein n=1 Tax=Araneus ventricosus TaxID=182803 RepID=A0A4Y2GZ72_ARAVE|nr:hypothetical protein AVEN_55617-1 [Araneus ventricosus]